MDWVLIYNYRFYKEAGHDLAKLDNSIKKLFAKKLSQIIKNPQMGYELGHINNLDLTGFRKAYFDNKRYRIVYQVCDDEIIIHIIAIGKRDNMEVYKKASQRIK